MRKLTEIVLGALIITVTCGAAALFIIEVFINAG